MPSLSIPKRMTSPSCRNLGTGLIPGPTPGGVPVVTTSPGCRVRNRLTQLTIRAIKNIMVRVFPSCILLPLTSSHKERLCGSGTSFLVTSQGPIGPNVSHPFPLSHVGPLSNWKARSLTPLTTHYPATNAKASSSLTCRAWPPMTTPSSTSQSSLVEPNGNMTSSFAPTMQEVAFENTTGSVGMGMFASCAWSE